VTRSHLRTWAKEKDDFYSLYANGRVELEVLARGRYTNWKVEGRVRSTHLSEIRTVPEWCVVAPYSSTRRA
jgi:hypothetical protein